MAVHFRPEDMPWSEWPTANLVNFYAAFYDAPKGTKMHLMAQGALAEYEKRHPISAADADIDALMESVN